jgi:hypothetical protein
MMPVRLQGFSQHALRRRRLSILRTPGHASGSRRAAQQTRSAAENTHHTSACHSPPVHFGGVRDATAKLALPGIPLRKVRSGPSGMKVPSGRSSGEPVAGEGCAHARPQAVILVRESCSATT